MPIIQDPHGHGTVHTLQIPLRWSDIDQYMHVNNAAYLEFSQDARAAYAREVFSDMAPDFPPMFVRTAQLDYQRPISNKAAYVTINTAVRRIGTTSFNLRQWVYDDQDNQAAVIDEVMVMVDPATSSPVAINKKSRAGLELAYREEGSG